MTDQVIGRHSAGRGTPRIREVPFDAPWDWLAAGWADMWRQPALSLAYGVGAAAAAILMLVGLFQFGWQSLILVFAGGFALLGPVLAVGLYEMSRRYEAGETVTAGQALSAGFKAKGQLLFLGLILAFVFFAWIRIAVLMFMLFIGSGGLPPVSDFIPTLLFTGQGLGLLVTGTAVGAALAALVFAISAVSVPLLMVKRVDAVKAVFTSLEAVTVNWQAMGLWAVLIAGFVALGIASLFVGLVFVFPLIGHATWHAFRAMVDTSDMD